MRGHLYCSERCARDAGRALIWAHVRRRIARPVPSRLAVAAVAVALAAPGVLALRAVSELDRLNAPFPAAPPTRRAPSARIDSVAEEPTGARVEGTAPEGMAVFLFAGGQFVAAAPVERGRFRFDAVRLPGPYRVGAIALSAAPSAALPPQFPPSVSSTREPEPAAQEPPASRLSPPSLAVPDFTRGPADRRELVVSFDGGSSDRGTAAILDALSARRLRTTIFLTGEFIRRYPDLTRRIAADGHEVGNHTDTHPHLTTYGEDGRQATRRGVDFAFLKGELDRTARLYRETTGRDVAPIWRAPFGEQNPELRRWAARAGYWHVGWTGGRAGLDGLDWVSDPRSRAYRSSNRVVELLLERAENGGIALLHLGSDREDPVARYVPALLDGLSGRGFRLARVTEFLDREGFTPDRLALLAQRPPN